MKIDTKQENALVVGADVTKFGLNLEDPGIFVQMLLNLYSDPIASSVRELVSTKLIKLLFIIFAEYTVSL